MNETMSIAEIMAIIADEGVNKANFARLVSQMLRAVCKDEHVDSVGEFIEWFENIDWPWDNDILT